MNFAKNFFTKVKAFIIAHKIWSIMIILSLILSLFFLIRGIGRNQKDTAANFQEFTVVKRTLTSTVTGSSVLEPNAEYSITPLVTGEILSAPFEEGDTVTKGQVMYQIDSETMENSLASSDISIQKAQNSYDNAVNDVTELTITAPLSGRISEVYTQEGSPIGGSAKIAEVVDDSVMKVRIPFNEPDISSITTGMDAQVTLVGTGSQLPGTVTSVNTAGEVVHGHMRVCYVTVSVNNPGAISAGDSATAMIGSIACNDVGTFEPAETTAIYTENSGIVKSLSVEKGDRISKGATVAILSSDSLDSQVTSSSLSLQDAQLARDKVLIQMRDYTITSPIDGTVVLKNKKAGEKIEKSESASSITGASTNTLAVIYDMSSLCFQLDVDELDVKKIKVGQKVSITADAAQGKTYDGIVENVSISGTVGTNGVTTYPVKVRIKEFDEELLPGMNIEATVTIEQIENVLAIPLNAINRGNNVYLKGEKTDDNDKAPEGYRTVTVETGISDDSFVEIRSGLVEGDIVYVPATVLENQQPMFPGMPGMGGMSPGGGMPPGGGMSPGGGMPNGTRSGGMPGGGR